MKNVIKKTCAIVMMTAVLFTTVAPKPVLASCAHSKTETNTEIVFNVIDHIVNGKTCTIVTSREYRVTRCVSCEKVFNRQFIKADVSHSSSH